MKNPHAAAWPRDLDRFLLLAAAVLAGEMFLIRANVGLGFTDEGFLWYGAQRVLRGEVPIRDFHSYDPGRYYWSALVFYLWRPGIVPLRFSQALAQLGGLFAALAAVKRATRDRWELAGLGLLLSLWMCPTYRSIDCALPMFGVYLGCRLLEDPGRRAVWASGAFVGLAAFFGRNHALYLGVSAGALLALRCWRARRWKDDAAAWALGLAAGLAPLLVMLAFVKGFCAAYLDALAGPWRAGATNVSLPIPWLWQFHWTLSPDRHEIVFLILRVVFLAMPLSYGYAALKGALGAKGTRLNALVPACALVGAAYFHEVFSRADFEHLAAGAAPFWLGLFALAGACALKRRSVLAAGLVLSFLSTGVASGLYDALRPEAAYPYDCVVSGDRLRVDLYTLDVIDGARRIAHALRPGEALLALPQLPGLYALLDRKSPVREIYTILPASEEEQGRMIEGIEKNNVRRAIIENEPIDARDDLRFMNTNPLVWNYLGAHFKRAADPVLPPNLLIFSR